MKFCDIWDSMCYAKRTALLKMAGYNKYHAGRCFQYLPANVKEDVAFCHRRKLAAA